MNYLAEEASKKFFGQVWEDVIGYLIYLKSKEVHPHPNSRLTSALERSRLVVKYWQRQEVPPGFDVHLGVGDLGNVW